MPQIYDTNIKEKANGLSPKEASPTEMLLALIAEKLDYAHKSMAQLNVALMPVMRVMPEEKKIGRELDGNHSPLETRLVEFSLSIERLVDDIASIKRSLSI